MAFGALYFDRLNIIAISFCSILFGLGDDFSLLLYQRYFQCRNAGLERETAIADSIGHCEPGILWVALTTGIGFLALCFSGSSGFAQLGILVALRRILRRSDADVLFLVGNALWSRHRPGRLAPSRVSAFSFQIVFWRRGATVHCSRGSQRDAMAGYPL
jgi:hypothetical protein